MLLLCLLLTGCGETLDSAVAVTPTPVPTYDVQALQATARALMQILPTASPKPGWPPSKAQGLQQSDVYQRAIRTAVAMNPPPNPLPPEWFPTHTVSSTPPFEDPTRAAGAGVIDDFVQPGPLSPIISTANTWLEQAGERKTVVHAGGQRGNLSQGMLAIEQRDATDPQPVDYYLTPYRAGAVRVQDAVGEQLILQTADGTTFYFDVPGRRWLSVLPTPPGRPGTATPAVTATPLPMLPPAFRSAGGGTLLEYGLTTDPPIPDPITNQWYEPIDVGELSKGQLRVFTGAEQGDAAQGLLIVATYGPYQTPTLQRYQSPQRDGTIRIVNAVGERLTLRADNGAVFYFDVPSRQWVTP